MNKTWLLTPQWRKYAVDQLNEISKKKITLHGKEFLSWIWIDFHNVELAKAAVDVAKSNGVYLCKVFVFINM